MGNNSRTFSKDHKNAKSSKEGTKKNIKTSLNKLQARNQTLFGPPGKNFYNPNSRFDNGGFLDAYGPGGTPKTRTDVYTNKNLYDKAHKAEMDSIMAQGYKDIYKQTWRNLLNAKNESDAIKAANNFNNNYFNKADASAETKALLNQQQRYPVDPEFMEGLIWKTTKEIPWDNVGVSTDDPPRLGPSLYPRVHNVYVPPKPTIQPEPATLKSKPKPKPIEKKKPEVITPEYLPMIEASMPEMRSQEPDITPQFVFPKSQTNPNGRISWTKDPETRRMVPVYLENNKQKVATGKRLYNDYIPTSTMGIPEDFIPQFDRQQYGGVPNMYPFGGQYTKTHTHFDEGGTFDPPPTSDDDEWMNRFLARDLAKKAIQNEEGRVAKVRSNVIPAARALDAADDKIVNDNGAVYEAFQKMRNAANPQELQALIRNAPAELKNVLPQGGNYNIAQWDKKAGDWNPQSTPGRELYCTPYGCYTYQKAGATDVPTIGGNYGFVGGVSKGELPFKKVSASEARPGDMAIIYGNQPTDYRDPNSRWVDRPHHTGVLADLPKLDKSGKAVEMSFYNANEGNRLSYGKNTRSPNERNKDSKYEYYAYVGQLPKLERQYAEAQKRFNEAPGQYMQSIPQQLITQSPDEREIIIPQQSTMANLSSRKKGGSLSGAPHDGQPTAEQFFQQTWIPPGPVGFYKLGGQNTDGIAFPQQVPDNYFFAGVPWQNDLGHFAYGGGLPGGSNEMPCLECGGYMEDGGETEFGGNVQGDMDYFKKGGNWIQNATESIKKRGTEGVCSGEKYGGPSCPPGSKRYNLAKTFRNLAKKALGGVNDTALDPQDDYINNLKNKFTDSLKMNWGLSEADKLAKQYDAPVIPNTSVTPNQPLANNGMNVGFNMDNMANYNMAQGMLNNMDNQRQSNQNLFAGTMNSFASDYANDPQTVKWKMKKSKGAPDLTNIQTSPYTNMQTSAYGGELYKAAFGVDAFGNPDPRGQMGPLSQEETNQRTINRYQNLPWNQQNTMMGPGPQGPPRFQGGLYPNVYPRGYRDGYSGWDGTGSMPWITSSNAPRGWQNDPGFDPRYREQNPGYQTSQNGQTRYDYNNPNAWDNLNQYRGGRGGSWNTQGWNSPNPFANAMFNNPDFYTGITGLDVKRGLFGSMANPKRVKMKFNTYVNPRTGKTEVVPAGPQNPQAPNQGPVQGPANKSTDKPFQDQVAEDKKKAASNNNSIPYAEQIKDQTPQPSARQKAIQDYMTSQLTPAGSSQRPADQPLNNQGYNPGFPVYNSANPLKSVPASSGNGWDNATKGQLPGPRADVMNTPPLSDRQKAIANSMQNQFAGPSQQSSNLTNAPINMDPNQMQNMPMVSGNTLPMGQTLIQPATGNYDFMNNVQQNTAPAAGPLNTAPSAPASQLPSIPPRVSGDYDFMNDLQNSQRPGPIMQQAYGGMPDYNYSYGGMPDYSYAYGGYLPMAAFGYNVYGQPDPNFMGPLSPQYEQTLMGAQPAEQAVGATPADPSGSITVKGKKESPITGKSVFSGSMLGLGLAKNFANRINERPNLEHEMMVGTQSQNVHSTERGYRGNELTTPQAYGATFGAQSDAPGGYTKNGGMIYANGGAYQTGIPVELTDAEIKAIMAAGGTVEYI